VGWIVSADCVFCIVGVVCIIGIDDCEIWSGSCPDYSKRCFLTKVENGTNETHSHNSNSGMFCCEGRAVDVGNGLERCVGNGGAQVTKHHSVYSGSSHTNFWRCHHCCQSLASDHC
jgi:hypothetical protein